MYKVASSRHQTVLHRGRPADWANGDEQSLPEDRLRDLKAAISNLDQRLRGSVGEERASMIEQKWKWQEEIRALRQDAQRMDQKNFERRFVDLAKEMLAPFQFKAIVAAAKRECERAAAEEAAAVDATVGEAAELDVNQPGD